MTVPNAQLGTLNRVRYTHDACIEQILLDPSISQGDLARMFGFSQSWMSICINSDAFQNRLEERKAEFVDPVLRASIAERLDAVAKRSLDKIMERLDSETGYIKTAELVQIAKLGVGDKNTRVAQPQTQNNLYVVHVPPPAETAEKWLGSRAPGTQPRDDGMVVDVTGVMRD